MNSPRQLAITKGKIYYSSSKPCKKCNNGTRLVSNNKCVKCMARNLAKKAQYRREVMKRYYERNGK